MGWLLLAGCVACADLSSLSIGLLVWAGINEPSVGDSTSWMKTESSPVRSWLVVLAVYVDKLNDWYVKDLLLIDLQQWQSH